MSKTLHINCLASLATLIASHTAFTIFQHGPVFQTFANMGITIRQSVGLGTIAYYGYLRDSWHDMTTLFFRLFA